MLEAKDFTRVASAGFGDPHNSHAWSMEWFQGRLYVGTSRDMLWVSRRMGNFSYLDPYPVALPPRAAMDLRAQIWRYTPETGRWEQDYTSPLRMRAVQHCVCGHVSGKEHDDETPSTHIPDGCSRITMEYDLPTHRTNSRYEYVGPTASPRICPSFVHRP